MDKLSVVIITFNEEKNIANCLSSIKEIADEIIIVDSFSTDDTKKICESFDVRFFQRTWDNYSKQKNYANSLASNDYVFSIDADEVVSMELCNSIKKEKEKFLFDTYKFNRLNFFCGKPVHYCGWYPDKKIRIWNKNKASWIGNVHETLSSNDNLSTKYLSGDLLHYTTDSLFSQIQKINVYTEEKAKRAALTKKKASLFKILFKPLYKFIHVYFIRLGVLDGFVGLLISMLSALDSFLFLCKLKIKNHED